MSAEEHYPLSGEDIDVIREDLLDGVPSVLIAADYNIPEGILLRAARGELDYEYDAEHPPLEYDPETAEWSIPEAYQQDPDPEPYTVENGRIWLPTHQVPPWARDDGEDDSSESSDNQSTDDSSDNAAATQTQTTMTNMTTTHADADGGNEQAHQTTVGNGNGETVAGTSPDDFGQIRTECWPSHIDPEDIGSELRQRIIQAAAMHRDWSQAQIARQLGTNRGNVSATLKKYWPTHPARTRGQNQDPALTVDEVDEIRRRLVAGGTSPKELAGEYDTSEGTIHHVAKGDREYSLEADHPPVAYDNTSKQWVVAEDREGERDTDPQDTTDETPTPPETLDLDDLTQEQERAILTAAVENPDWSQSQIAEHVDCDTPAVSNTLRVYWPTHPSVQTSDRSEPFTVEDVDKIRNRLLDGESLSDLATDLNVSNGIISKLARGAYSLGDAAETPALDHDQKAGGWLLASDAPEPEPEHEQEQENGNEPDTDTHPDADDITILAYGEDIFHYRDESGLAACGIWSADDNPSAPLVSLEREEAEKVADECPQCRIASRTTDELLDDIRAELGHPLKDEGTPLTQEELADVLARLRDQDQDQGEEGEQ